MLAKIKLLLELSDTTFDAEINDYIKYAIHDLEDIGVETAVHVINGAYTSARPSIERAITTYCQAQFALSHGYPSNYEQIKEAYENQKDKLRKTSKYRSRNG